MANFKLYEYGIENILEDIEKILKSVIGKDKSKRAKDIAICKVIGMVNALNMAIIPETEEKEEEVSE
jgi:hypothetical protein